MARSDERAAVDEAAVTELAYELRLCGVNIHRDVLAEALTSIRLHVVTAADMRVLKAMRDADIRVSDTGYDGPVMPLADEYAVCRAELARREGNR